METKSIAELPRYEMPEDEEALFASFCAADRGRYDLTKPFYRGGFRFATDGKHLILKASDEPDSEGDHPDAHKLFNLSSLTFGRETMLLERTSYQCSTCRGTGLTLDEMDCDECDGAGEITCNHCGSEIDCEKCRGNGVIANPFGKCCCGECHGHGARHWVRKGGNPEMSCEWEAAKLWGWLSHPDATWASDGDYQFFVRIGEYIALWMQHSNHHAISSATAIDRVGALPATTQGAE